jgi:transcriptional regulator GlxA family with amidase domain
MNIAVVAFDGFTDVDAFLPFDFFHRVKVPYGAGYEGPWQVSLLADRARITSYSGVAVEAHGSLAEASAADGVFVVSGDGSRAKIADPAALGLLDGLSATTYPIIMHELEAMGVHAENRPLVVHGNIATGGGCLASLDLCAWMVGRLLSVAAAARVRASFEPIGGFGALARAATW